MAPRFDAVGMVVADMTRTLAFYRRLGLDIPAGADSEPHVDFAFPSGMRLMWDTEEIIKGIEPDWVRPVGQSVSLAFACDSPAEVDSVYAEMVAAGFDGHQKPWDAFWGQRYALLRDPDGHQVDLFAPLSTD